MLSCNVANAQSREWSVSYGGQLRERFESVRNPVFGLTSQQDDDYLLHRIFLSADIQQQDRFRLFGELVSAQTSGWEGTAPPTQDDELDLLQAFFEAKFDLRGSELQVRAGRQEISLGSSRLVSVRESPNVRRVFDAVRSSSMLDDSLRIDGFVARPVSPQDGHFDDRSSSEQVLWGVYATRKPWDVYYLGLKRNDAMFSTGRADERRHTVGTRLFSETDDSAHGPDWNLEGAWQWGSFGDLNISAWTLSADVGYTFTTTFSPRIGLKADAISGDRNPGDRTLGTFNPLFPKLPYFSEANLATPANLLDLQPSLTLSLPGHVTLATSWNVLWKFARQDAFYSPPLAPVARTAASQSRSIGEQASVGIGWEITHGLSFAATYVRFDPGALTRNVGGESGNFGTAWVQFQF
ncbi:MAG: alginate export family protein [Steroidobacteraceae bacterium]